MGDGNRAELVAWMLEYDYGAVGFLHTHEASRQRGYGRAVARALTLELAAAHIALFEGLGFARQGGPVAWLRFCPIAADDAGDEVGVGRQSTS